jgi:hypothetical protein
MHVGMYVIKKFYIENAFPDHKNITYVLAYTCMYVYSIMHTQLLSTRVR